MNSEEVGQKWSTIKAHPCLSITGIKSVSRLVNFFFRNDLSIDINTPSEFPQGLILLPVNLNLVIFQIACFRPPLRTNRLFLENNPYNLEI